MKVCPTGAIVAPYRLDARRCIAYLTIEHKGPIPKALRPLLGNRVFGCDDCQMVCPWNRYAGRAALPDFEARRGLDAASLVRLFSWDEAQYLRNTEGSALRRVGYEGWLRNLAVALGNAPPDAEDGAECGRALERRLGYPSELVREHVRWALAHRRDSARPAVAQPRHIDAASAGACTEGGGESSVAPGA